MPPSGARSSVRACCAVYAAILSLVVAYSTIHHSNGVIPEDIAYTFFIQASADKFFREFGIILNTGKTGGHISDTIQVAAQCNMFSTGIEFHKMQNMITHRIKRRL